MGDIGDYWREHKEFARDRKAADSLGMSLSKYRLDMRKMKAEERVEAKAQKLAKCTIQCECGRRFLAPNDHACHVRSQGKKGHAIALTREVPKEEPADWAIF
jgi:hypothetical protein